ncbi:hypothetical protein BAUCODRAFT_34931 [Baudoinia panamericana UAMH 10762]|uniref:Myotubularin phosphatase domain-containing protein n=1 Tax=Baudoinia panamericana (strain UAMH 10762) TaxID=717646 RepID=M2LKW6_BAUPA|nr:uncharacterized protein BAUCODRAFT_34931 [Baudoinia panamericana UAMH 10762]EMC94927.1 hypothetical protein BAUCODRAFT_34931 [Baudoinia panamericana UAMH 10762]
MRVRNVALHQRGKRVKGTLTLENFHLTFTFAPDDGNGIASSQGEHDRHASGQHSALPDAGKESSNNHVEAASTPKTNVSKDASLRRKAKTKTIWIGYPMINSCVLRPSHLRSHAGTNVTVNGDAHGWNEADDAFPPSFGTGGYGRPSVDSARLAPYSASPQRPASPATSFVEDGHGADSGRSPAIRIRCRDFQMMALHFYPTPDGRSPDDMAREVFFALRSKCCVDKVEDMLAFHFQPPVEEAAVEIPEYDARKEFARMGIGGKAPEGPGSAWRVSDINEQYAFSATYPSLLCTPRNVSDNMLKYGGLFRSRARIPALTYLHFNGGSITRSSQPLVGVQGKRNPQDERLVSAIFSSHTPPLEASSHDPQQEPSLTSASTTTLDSTASGSTGDAEVPGLKSSQSESVLDEAAADASQLLKRKVYGSTRHNLIVDARPRINALANRATGGGIEDVSNYYGPADVPVERVFLNIQNIHVMRSSLEKVVESFESSDYTTLAPDQELLRKSGWLGHIAGLLEGAELVARAVGLAGSHALIHCSDGWDRTSQVAALAQVLLDPHYRTLNGFITLVQKDFLAFGHKFRDRNGIGGSEKWFEIENERIAPSRARDAAGSESSSLNAIGVKALSGAKSWFEKNRASLFRQQNPGVDSTNDALSRPASPPPNPLIHSPPTASGKDEKEHHTSEKEIAPIFHQFLDAVFQLQRQYPTAFQFNELFLRRLLYQVYAGQYGEFLFNNEKERSAQQGKVPSVWIHFLSRRGDFIHHDFAPEDKDTLLLPKRDQNMQIEVRWWSRLFQRNDNEMNLPRALAPADPPSFNAQPSSVSLDDRATPGAENMASSKSGDAQLREAKSSPNLGGMVDNLSNSMAAMISGGTATPAQDTPTRANHRTPTAPQETYDELPETSGASSLPAAGSATELSMRKMMQDQEDEGDPLGVTAHVPQALPRSEINMAVFASQNAFSDR